MGNVSALSRKAPHHCQGRFDADVAQLVEQLIRNQQVTSSSLVIGSLIIRELQSEGQKTGLMFVLYLCRFATVICPQLGRLAPRFFGEPISVLIFFQPEVTHGWRCDLNGGG